MRQETEEEEEEEASEPRELHKEKQGWIQHCDAWQ